jgi:hypothetical protein
MRRRKETSHQSHLPQAAPEHEPRGSSWEAGAGFIERETMEAIKRALLPSPRNMSMARDLLWFAAASVGAGLVTALSAAAVVVLLA